MRRLLVDLLLPPRCLGCGRIDREPFCRPCEELLEPDGEGHELAQGVIAVACHVYADPLAAAIKRVKTDALRGGAEALAGMLAPSLPSRALRTWVPAPPARRRRRGLDLAQVLAGPGAVPLLRSTRTRVDQADLDAAGRRSATIGAYQAVVVVPPAVVVVDDVRATGATLLAAATALRDAGARRVLAITLAASPGPPSASRSPSRRPHPRAGVAGRASAGSSARSS